MEDERKSRSYRLPAKTDKQLAELKKRMPHGVSLSDIVEQAVSEMHERITKGTEARLERIERAVDALAEEARARLERLENER